MTANIVRRPSQETEGSVSPILFPDKSESGRVSVASEGCSLANLTQNVFRRVSSDRGDGVSSSLPLAAVASLVGKVNVVPSETPIKLVEDYTDSECSSDSEDSIEVIIQPDKVNDTNLVEKIETSVKLLDQDLLDKVAAQRVLFPSPSIKDSPSSMSSLRKEEIEVWIKGSIEAPNLFNIEESNKQSELKDQAAVKSEKVYSTPLRRPDIDERIDAFLENNPCTRLANWMLSFIPNFISSPKSSIEKAEEEKAREKQEIYDAFITRLKKSDKISKEKFEQVRLANNGALILKKSFESYQALMGKDLRGYRGADKDEKVFNRSMQIILNARLK